MSENKKPSIFKDSKFPIDMCDIKGVMPFSNIDQELFKKYYSSSAVGLDLILDAVEILKAFHGKNLLEKENAKIFFPKDTTDPILILYEIPMWSDGDWSSKETAPYSMCIAIAPRARLADEKCSDYPMLSELEQRKTSVTDGQLNKEKRIS